MTRAGTTVLPCCGATLPADARYVEQKCSIGHCVSLFCAACGAYLATIGAGNCPCKTRTCSHG